MHYKTVFDASQSPPEWQFAAFGLIFVAAGLVFFFFPQLNKKWTAQRTRVFCIIYIAGALVWTAVAAVANYMQHEQAKSAIEHHAFKSVEGTVQNFLPMGEAGRKSESFDVGGQHFSYSDYVITPGFRKTAVHGGPIHEGLPVRIDYVDNATVGPEILRLEIDDSAP
jgi:hypothetical protein